MWIKYVKNVIIEIKRVINMSAHLYHVVIDLHIFSIDKKLNTQVSQIKETIQKLLKLLNSESTDDMCMTSIFLFLHVREIMENIESNITKYKDSQQSM
jgi:hypothetical protein